MSWTDPCGNCGNNRADCDCEDGYSSVRTNDVNTEEKQCNLPVVVVSEERAEVFELLQVLLDGNMCSYHGDELIKKYINSKT